jgi:Histone methylation protein DOT1
MVPAPADHRSLTRSFLRWWRDGIHQNGFLKTSLNLLNELATFLKESTPEYKRRRYGDIEYDWGTHVDTTSATVSFRDRLLGIFNSSYQATEAQLFQQMMAAFIEINGRAAIFGNSSQSPSGCPPLDLNQFCFIDLGSGKGRVLLMASEYPFRRIIGVELLPNLNAIAEENIRKFKSVSQKCFNIVSICADALDFDFPPEPIVLYLFNPFPASILERVIAKLELALDETPRPVFVLYHNPLLEHILSRSGKLKKLSGTHQYVIYGN